MLLNLLRVQSPNPKFKTGFFRGGERKESKIQKDQWEERENPIKGVGCQGRQNEGAKKREKINDVLSVITLSIPSSSNSPLPHDVLMHQVTACAGVCNYIGCLRNLVMRRSYIRISI